TPSHQVAENLSVTSPQTTSESQYLGDSASFHESQIRIADSLYKNYLPQYNFDEVKAAMEFFDSIRNDELAIRNYGGRKAIPNSTFLIPNYQCAKAHYYHAVGLTEKDDIVGACEHYLIALEIMEEMMANDKRLKAKGKKSTDNPEDYEKIRFVALICNRLGRLFYNESYCDLAIFKYKKALGYIEFLKDKQAEANVLKELGNSYQLSNKPDSALYYYKESLKCNSSLPNKLDIEKSIAQIKYFSRNEKDSAYAMLRNNLNKIDNKIVKYAYHHTLGNMFYKDNAYDSALYYLEESLEDSIIIKKLAFTTTLSAIYDSIGDYEKKAYYDNISSRLFKDNINEDVEKTKIQVLYENYNKIKIEKENFENKIKTRKKIIMLSLVTLILVAFILLYIKYMHRQQSNKLKSEIDDYVNKIDNYSNDIENKNIIIDQKEKLIKEYQITNDNKDKIIDKQKKEIDRIKTRISKKNVNVEAYYTSDICKKILSRKDNDFSYLKEEELALLLESADKHLDNISYRLQNSFPELNKKDIYTICLLILNLEKKLPVLLGKNPKTIWVRLHRLKNIMGVESNQDLFIYIKDNFLN
ncbi:MAG: hypothetical protein IKU01_01195, partial [Bacteroidales bacterium]|nr:hypothetical protein [Bacteroidales bacterium]